MAVPRTVELDERDLRVVARYAVQQAEAVLALFEKRRPRDRRPRAAIEAAWLFIEGAPRSRLQRTAALAAHKAAMQVSDEAAREAARAAGHAAAAAYLHPLAKATQVRHILGAAACAARALEHAADDETVGERHIVTARRLASRALIAILRRYPAAPERGNRTTQLMKQLDTALRSKG
jgi:hypothetical protein